MTTNLALFPLAAFLLSRRIQGMLLSPLSMIRTDLQYISIQHKIRMSPDYGRVPMAPLEWHETIQVMKIQNLNSSL